jgi:hypothetical protein
VIRLYLSLVLALCRTGECLPLSHLTEWWLRCKLSIQCTECIRRLCSLSVISVRHGLCNSLEGSRLQNHYTSGVGGTSWWCSGSDSLSCNSHGLWGFPLASVLFPLALVADARPMSNLLTPPGLLAWQKGRYGGPLTASDSRMVPKEWELSEAGFTDATLKQTTSVFHWEHLSAHLVCPALSAHKSSAGNLPSAVDPISVPAEPVPEFSWCPPDLSSGDVWYWERFTNLVAAAAHYENRVQLVHDGVRALTAHRSN